MKKLFVTSLFALGAVAAPAAILYVDVGSLIIPNDLEGIYIKLDPSGGPSGFFETAYEYPLDFNDAPWINLYLGGQGIANSELLRPWASQQPGDYEAGTPGHYFLNLPQNTIVDSSGVFVSGESASDGHMEVDGSPLPNQFRNGEKGYLAFEYQATAAGAISYGWFSFTPNTGGPGYSVDLVFSDTPGETVTVIPEPASYSLCGGLVVLAAGVFNRRRRLREN